MKYYLAIDIGVSSGRHIVGWEEDGKIVTDEVFRFPNGAKNVEGHLEWDIESLFSSVKLGIGRALKKYPHICSLAIDTWGVDYVIINGDEPFMPCLSYRDMRTEAVIDEVHAIVPFEELYKRTGIQPFNTIYQLYEDKKRERLYAATDFLMVPEYLDFLLTGVIIKEYTNAMTTGLLNAKTGEWDWDIIQTLGLPREIFGKLYAPGDSATFTYSLEVENYAGSATVTTALSTGETDTNFDAAYFTVTYTVGEDQTVYSNDEPYTVTSADNGKNIVVTVTMNDEEPCYTFANMPTFSTVTLTVSLVEGESEQTGIADFVKDFSVESNDGAWKYGSAVYAWDGTQAIKNSGETESFTFTAATEKNSSSDGWTADGVEIKSGWISGDAAISYTFDGAVNADVAVSFQGQEEGTRMDTRIIVVGSDGTAKVWEYKAQTEKDWNYTQSVQAAEGDVVYVIFFTAEENTGLAQGSLNIAITAAQA